MAWNGTVLAAVSVAMLAAGGPAFAQKQALIDGKDPDVIVELMRGFGSARRDTADDGMPMIRGRIDGDGFSGFFYGCGEKKDACSSIGFSVFFDEDKVTLEDVNAWNLANRYGRAYINKKGEPVLEMDINFENGITIDNFERSMDIWTRILKDFGATVVNRDRSGSPKDPPQRETRP